MTDRQRDPRVRSASPPVGAYARAARRCSPGVRGRLALGMLLALFVGGSEIRAQDRLFTHIGPSDDAGLGYAVTGLSDIDGDGVGDYVVGSLGCTSMNGSFALVYSGATGALVRDHTGDTGGGCYGMGMADLGDLDGDGVTDYAIAAVREDSQFALQGGRIYVYSGVDGSLLRVYEGDAPGARFGLSIASVGDVDLDGVPDMLTGSAWDGTLGPQRGSADVYSGASGDLVHHLEGALDLYAFGFSVAGVDDVDGDGVQEMLIGAPYGWYGATGDEPAGYVQLVSGLTAEVLATYEGVPPEDHYGTSVAGIGDLDGDGVGELLIGAPRRRAPDPGGSGVVDVGLLEVRSAVSGTVLFTALGDPHSKYASSVRSIGDLDGDGFDDVLVGACYCQTNIYLSPIPGWFDVHSGATGERLVRVDDGKSQQSFAWSVAPLGDITADGVPDFVVGNTFDATLGSKTGSAYVYSGADLSLLATRQEISLAQGGMQALELDAGPLQGGRTYLLLGSISGSSPGFGVSGAHVPLNPDVWFDVSYQYPNNGVLLDSLGVLDVAGRATAAVNLPPGLVPASAIGLVMHHAYVVLAPGGGVAFASNALPLTLLP